MNSAEDKASALFKVMEGSQTASEQKRFLKTHLDLTQSLSDAMLKGELHKFNEQAEAMLYENKFDQEAIEALVTSKNDATQRVRLALLHYLLSDPQDQVCVAA